MSQKSVTGSLGICYLKGVEGQVSLSTLVLDTARVYKNSSFFGYIITSPRLKSCGKSTP